MKMSSALGPVETSQGILEQQIDPLACIAMAVIDSRPYPAEWKGPAVSDPTIQPSCFVWPRPLLVPS